MAQEGGPKGRRRRDQERAAAMKEQGVCRTTGRCAVCYKIIPIDSWKSRYTHKCS